MSHRPSAKSEDDVQRMMMLLGSGLVLLTGFLPLSAYPMEEPADANQAMDALKAVQEIVGQWEGSGKSDATPLWKEDVDCAWKFKKGKASLYLTLKGGGNKAKGRLLDEAMLSYDPGKQIYVFRAYKAGVDSEAALVQFEGTQKPGSKIPNLILDRVRKGNANDPLDRLDLKLIDEDHAAYSFQRRIGQSKTYRSYALVLLNRKGTSLATARASGPKCIVTGGVGTMTVEYKGQTYYVCCSGCREMFLETPEKFLAKAAKQ